MSSDKPSRARDENGSGIPILPFYTDGDPAGEVPGKYPFTRGVRADMYRGRLWTMRQYAGFGSAAESNARYRYLLARAQTGLSVAFDLPTQLGLRLRRAAVARRSRQGRGRDRHGRRHRTLFDGIPLDKVTVSMTINAPASILLAMVLAVARRRGIPFDKLGGTVQNDVLKEYVARGTYIYPPAPSMRLVTDVMAYCARERARSGTRSRSPVTTSAKPARPRSKRSRSRSPTRRRTCGRRAAAGLDVDEVAPRISFFWNAHNDFFEEIAKFRAARSLWAHIVRDEFGSHGPALADAALPHADRRLDADRARTRQQRRAGDDAGARGGARRHAVAAHERQGRSAGLADRRGGQASPCARSRSSATRAASPTSSTRWPARTTSKR